MFTKLSPAQNNLHHWGMNISGELDPEITTDLLSQATNPETAIDASRLGMIMLAGTVGGLNLSVWPGPSDAKWKDAFANAADLMDQCAEVSYQPFVLSHIDLHGSYRYRNGKQTHIITSAYVNLLGSVSKLLIEDEAVEGVSIYPAALTLNTKRLANPATYNLSIGGELTDRYGLRA